MTFVETQRRARGHVFLPPKAVQRKTPALYGTEATPLDQKVVHVHYFAGGWDWYVTEANWESGRAFGLVKSPMGSEWGYFDLAEMEAVKPRAKAAGQTLTLSWVVERDCHWTPVTAGAL